MHFAPPVFSLRFASEAIAHPSLLVTRLQEDEKLFAFILRLERNSYLRLGERQFNTMS